MLVCVNELGKRRHKWDSKCAVFVMATCQVASPGAKTLELYEMMSWKQKDEKSTHQDLMRWCSEWMTGSKTEATSHPRAERREKAHTAANRYSRATLQHPHLVSMATKWTGIPFSRSSFFQSRLASLLEMKGVCVCVRQCVCVCVCTWETETDGTTNKAPVAFCV